MLRVLCQVAQVPDRTKVTKRDGEMVYTARHNIAIWGGGKTTFLEPQQDDAVFLVDHEGTIRVVPGTTEVLANFDPNHFTAAAALNSLLNKVN